MPIPFYSFRKLTHAIWHCQHHIIWVPKYHFRILEDEISKEVSAWNLQSDGSYLSVNPHPRKGAEGCQEKLIKLAEKRRHEAQRLRKRRSRQAGNSNRKKT